MPLDSQMCVLYSNPFSLENLTHAEMYSDEQCTAQRKTIISKLSTKMLLSSHGSKKSQVIMACNSVQWLLWHWVEVNHEYSF